MHWLAGVEWGKESTLYLKCVAASLLGMDPYQLPWISYGLDYNSPLSGYKGGYTFFLTPFYVL